MDRAFQKIKPTMMKALVLALPSLKKLFVVDSVTPQVGIVGVLSQEGHLVPFFDEKFNEAKRYSAATLLLS